MTENLPSTVSGGGEIAALQQEMRQPGSAYWTEPGKQVRYRELVERRDAGQSAPAAPSRDSARMAELKALMKDGRSAYWLGPQAKHLQAEYRGLIPSHEVGNAHRAGTAPPARVDPGKPAAEVKHGMVALSADASVANLNDTPEGRKLVAEWGSEAKANAGAAIRQAASILNDLTPAGAKALVEAFDSLSDEENARAMAWLANSGRARETR